VLITYTLPVSISEIQCVPKVLIDRKLSKLVSILITLLKLYF